MLTKLLYSNPPTFLLFLLDHALLVHLIIYNILGVLYYYYVLSYNKFEKHLAEKAKFYSLQQRNPLNKPSTQLNHFKSGSFQSSIRFYNRLVNLVKSFKILKEKKAD